MNEFGKYNPPVIYRCQSCDAAIRKDDKYYKLNVKGQPFIFCALCVELSDHIAYEKEISLIKENVKMNKCKICGKEFDDSPFYDYLHLCSQECHTIDFWNRALDNKAIIIGGECYHDGGNKPDEKRTSLLGHSGRKFKILFKDTGKIIETNNLWYNGIVPKERNIADNAFFL